jgi:hypothetical protein
MVLLIWSNELRGAGIDNFWRNIHYTIHEASSRLYWFSPTSAPALILCKCCKLISANLSLAYRSNDSARKRTCIVTRYIGHSVMGSPFVFFFVLPVFSLFVQPCKPSGDVEVRLTGLLNPISSREKYLICTILLLCAYKVRCHVLRNTNNLICQQGHI